MGKFQPPAIEESVTPNLIPMIDIMFLLLLFFMLGADMSQRELTEVILPEADQAQETNNVSETGAQYLTLNIHAKNDAAADAMSPEGRDESNWQFAIRGQEFTPDTLLDQLKVEADRARETEAVEGTKPPKYLSAVFVSIRADRHSPYGMIQKAMTYCALADLYKIDIGAAKPPSR